MVNIADVTSSQFVNFSFLRFFEGCLACIACNTADEKGSFSVHSFNHHYLSMSHRIQVTGVSYKWYPSVAGLPHLY